MNVKSRIITIRLMEKIKKKPDYAKKIRVSVKFKKETSAQK